MRPGLMRRFFAPLLLLALGLAACDSSPDSGDSYTVELGAKPQAAFGSSASAALSSVSRTDSLNPVIDASGESVTVVEAGQEISVTAGDTVRLKACIPPACSDQYVGFRRNFGQWGGDLEGRTENPTTVRVTKDMTIFAIFRVAESYNIQYRFLSGDTLDSGEEQTLDVDATIETYRGETKAADYISVVQNAPGQEDKYVENMQTMTHSWTPQKPGKKCVEISASWGIRGRVIVDSLYVKPLTLQNTEKICGYTG